MPSKIEHQAESLLNLFCDRANALFQSRVTAIFKLGSLGAHGDFSRCSDVDVALILDRVQDGDAITVNSMWEQMKQEKIPYADRLSVFWTSYADFEKGVGRFPALDRLDFIKHAVLLQGQDDRKLLSMPSQDTILQESAKFIMTHMLTPEKLEAIASDPLSIARKGARYFTKCILFPVRLIYSVDHPDSVGSNHDAVVYFTASTKFSSQLKNLVDFAYQARSLEPNTAVDVSLLIDYANSLRQLYLTCLENYYSYILPFDKTLAQELAKCRDSL